MGDIKTRFTLEGEQQYRSAMTNAANAIKVLNSQQKLATAQFKNTGDAEKYAQQQTEILKQKIAQQKTAVDAAAKALKELADKGVKENSKQFQQWQTKLNNAQTQLTNMETELKNVSESMQETTTYAEGTATAVESIGRKVSYDAVITGLGKVTNAMQSAARMAKDLTMGLFNSTRDAAAWADNLATNAIVYGFSVDELQGMTLAAELFDTSVEAIVQSRKKLSNNIVYGSDDVKNAFRLLGVETRGFADAENGDYRIVYRDIEDIYWDLGEAIKNYGDVIERNAMAQKVFGRSWDELLPIFTAGREAYEDVVQEASKVDDEQIAKLTALDDAIQKLTYEWSVTKNTLSAELAPAFETVSNAITELLKQFNEYLQTEEGQEKLGDLSTAVTDLFSGLSNADFGAALDTAKGALDAITDGLGWIKDNKDGIVNALKGIAIGFGALKLATVGLEIGKVVSGLKGLFGGGGGGTPAGNTPAGGGSGVGATVAGALKTGAKTIAKVAPYAAIPVALYEATVGQQIWINEEVKAAREYYQKAREDYTATLAQGVGTPLGDAYRQIGGAWASGEGQGEVLRDIASRYGAWLNGADDAGMDALIDTLEDATTAKLEGMINTFYPNQNGEWETTGLDPQAVTDLFEEMSRQLEAAIVKDPPALQFDPDIEKLQIDLNNSGLTVPLTPYLRDFGSVVNGIKGHANGLPYVPFDGYPAILHKGERVVTARENAGNYSSNLYVESMYMNGGTDAAGLAAAMAAAQRREMAGYGS